MKWWAGALVEESWSIDYYRLYGDLSRPEIWQVIAEKLRQSFQREDGVMMNIAQVCMDSGGHFTDEVYAFSRKVGIDWLIPIKGASLAGKPIANFPKTKQQERRLSHFSGHRYRQRADLPALPGSGAWSWLLPLADQGLF